MALTIDGHELTREEYHLWIASASLGILFGSLGFFLGRHVAKGVAKVDEKLPVTNYDGS